jgi:ribosomal protein S18 acetylase RimI-like enzyme
MERTAQERAYTDAYPHSEHRIILLDGEPVGRLWLADGPDERLLIDIAVLPEARRQGAGRAATAQAIAEAEALGLRVRVTVERQNTASLALCASLGFVEQGGDELLVSLVRA